VVIATAALGAQGCGSKGLDAPLPKAKQRLAVRAPWRDGATIPRRYTCDGGNVRPRIEPTHGNAGVDRVIVMTDPDAPGGTFVHWTTWSGAEGENSFGKVGYSGPCPPKGDKPHHYVATVYALSRPLGLEAGAKPDPVMAAIRASSVASGSVTGTYGR
jgi:phosphatidylethanolamine-binding protein (PEBP) family uncharacterized protein